MSTSSGDDSSHILFIAASTSCDDTSCPSLRLLNTPGRHSVIQLVNRTIYTVIIFSLHLDILLQIFFLHTFHKCPQEVLRYECTVMFKFLVTAIYGILQTFLSLKLQRLCAVSVRTTVMGTTMWRLLKWWHLIITP